MPNFLTDRAKRALKIAVTDKKAADEVIDNTNLLVGSYSTVGGAAVEVATISGVSAGDIVVCSFKSSGAIPVTVEGAEATDTDEVTFTFSADPDNDHVVNYIIFKA